MEFLGQVEVSGGGRPILDPNEVEVRMDPATRFYNRDDKVYDPCVATLTTHRVLWAAENNNIRLAASLELVSAVTDKSGFMKTPKLRLELAGDQRSYVTIGFPKGGKNEFLKALTAAIAGKAWERKDRLSANPTVAAAAAPPPSGRSGMAALMDMREQREKSTGQTMGTALGDLDGLMLHAREMVDIAERMKRLLADEEAKGAAREGGEKGVQGEYAQLLLNTGIVSPVSKEVAGADLFHAELSGQLADFLLPILEGQPDGKGGTSTGGLKMMTLTDIYCLYNRARGIDMVSPADLHKACELFQPRGVPLRLKAFASGVLVVQSEKAMGDTASDALQQLLSSTPAGVTAAHLSQALGYTMRVSRDLLEKSESDGEICRDDSIEGLRFFPNFIQTPPATWVA
ncbi:EAP30/Vps36 family-domain-containing protein [Baffinella frigidus]|nr:EAP30/Vps36 family-domain-containing protein [Cryptophyta sp. CCMP2293]